MIRSRSGHQRDGHQHRDHLGGQQPDQHQHQRLRRAGPHRAATADLENNINSEADAPSDQN